MCYWIIRCAHPAGRPLDVQRATRFCPASAEMTNHELIRGSLNRMRDPDNVFHLAIPSHDLDLAYHFFVELLGCRLARRYNDRITLELFGDQVVCHLDPDFIPEEPKMYPRHFGITFR